LDFDNDPDHDAGPGIFDGIFAEIFTAAE